MKNYQLIFFALIALLILTSCTKESDSKETREQLPVTKNSQPIVLVPGTNGTANDFDDFIADVSKIYDYQPEILRLTVNEDNSIIHSDEPLKKNAYRPFIVIAFENATEDGTLEQSKRLKTALKSLEKKYSFKNFDAVGYSNGGLVLTHFLKHDANTTKIKLRRMVTLATPYNYLSMDENGKEKKVTPLPFHNELLTELLTDDDSIPQNISYLNITGDIDSDHGSDSVVPVNSALAGRLIYQDKIKSYKEQIFSGKQYSHSGIVNATASEKAVMSFLYGD